MIGQRRSRLAAALTIVLLPACAPERVPLAGDAEETVHAWLVCEECIVGERQAVRAIGQPSVPYLASVIDSVPAVIVEPMRVRLFNRWTAAFGADRDAYVTNGVENIESLARIRAAQSLGDLFAAGELRDALALARSRNYREDVLREIEGALLAATRPVTAVNRVRVEPGTLTIPVGGTGEPAAFVEDSLGNVRNATPTWTSSNANVATVDGSGIVTGVEVGTAVIRATWNGLSDTTVVTVTATPAVARVLTVTGGNHQSAGSGELLADSLVVTITTAGGEAVSGATVTWSVLLGGGTVQPVSTVTRPDGTARVAWRVGGAGPQRLEAGSQDAPAVVFRATAND